MQENDFTKSMLTYNGPGTNFLEKKTITNLKASFFAMDRVRLAYTAS